MFCIDNYAFPGQTVGIYKSDKIYPLKKLMYDGVKYNVPMTIWRHLTGHLEIFILFLMIS